MDGAIHRGARPLGATVSVDEPGGALHTRRNVDPTPVGSAPVLNAVGDLGHNGLVDADFVVRFHPFFHFLDVGAEIPFAL